jgi:hypothetical protein
MVEKLEEKSKTRLSLSALLLHLLHFTLQFAFFFLFIKKEEGGDHY